MPDFIYNGQAHGSVAAAMLQNNFDNGCLRPWLSAKDGRSYVTVHNGFNAQGQPQYKNLVVNAPALLIKDEWKQFDNAVLRAALPRLRAFADLRASNSYVIPNGMAKTVLEHQMVSDVTGAIISMDGLNKSQRDRPLADTGSIPLPIVHKDFNFSARQVMVSRNGGMPLDTTMAELAARKVAEEIEKLTLGTAATFTYAGGTVAGYTNFANRITSVTLTDPGTVGWTPDVLVDEIVDMRQASRDAFHFGPWVLYFSDEWGQYLDMDYSATYAGVTLRQRLRQIEGITDVRTVDYLATGTPQAILVQMTPDTARAVIGMDITTLQWESHGGLELNFKVMAIMVPQLRSDYDGNSGIVHALAA